jgi:hypothetical protein
VVSSGSTNRLTAWAMLSGVSLLMHG